MNTLNNVKEILENIEVPKDIIQKTLNILKDHHENSLMNKLTDVTIGNYRIINASVIDVIQKDEIESDTYLLGSFNASFLAPILGCPLEAIEALQEQERYEIIGEWIIEQQKVWDIQEEYSYLDGYGHHFASYDGVTEEFSFDHEDYYIFRIS